MSGGNVEAPKKTLSKLRSTPIPRLLHSTSLLREKPCSSKRTASFLTKTATSFYENSMKQVLEQTSLRNKSISNPMLARNLLKIAWGLRGASTLVPRWSSKSPFSRKNKCRSIENNLMKNYKSHKETIHTSRHLQSLACLTQLMISRTSLPSSNKNLNKSILKMSSSTKKSMTSKSSTETE